jgi:enoyl-CoA hydratase/carnithine racemase
VIAYERRGAVAWAVLDRPEKLNAMAPAFWDELRAVLDRADADDAVRVLVFHGAGRCFSVGGDMDGFGELADDAQRRAYVRSALEALRAVEHADTPTIAAVHGHALGGGCELTMVCDIVVADETARFGLPESAVGLVPGLAMARGGAQLNLHWLKYLVLTGESIDAHEARLAGLVNRVTAPGEHVAEAARLAEAVAARAPLALSEGKRLARAHAPELYDEAIDAVSALLASTDHRAALEAFRTRETPRFEGR